MKITRPKKIALLPILLFAVLCCGLIVKLPTGTPAHAANMPALASPFDNGSEWVVCQGYNGPYTHKGSDMYSLDFASPGCNASDASGKNMRSPVAGKVYSYGASYGVLCVNTYDGRSVALVHINSDFRAGWIVNAGQSVGSVAAPGQKGNAGMSHLHLQMWSTPNCFNNSVIPFDADHDAQICGAPSMTPNGYDYYKNGAWSGTKVVGSSCTASKEGVYHVFTGNDAGKLYESYWSRGRPTITGNYATLPSPITSMNFERSPDGVYHTYSGTTIGKVYESYWGQGYPMTTGPNVDLGEPINSSLGFTSPDKWMHIFAVTKSNKLYETYWKGGVAPVTKLLATIPSSVSKIAYDQSYNGTNYIYAAAADGRVYRASWGENRSAVSLAPITALGEPLTDLDAKTTSEGYHHVIASTESGKIHETFWREDAGPSTWMVFDAKEKINALNFEVTPNGVYHIYSGSASGKKRETVWMGGYQLSTWTVADIKEEILSIEGLTTEDNVHHIFVGTALGNTFESYWGGGMRLTTGKFGQPGGRINAIEFVAT